MSKRAGAAMEQKKARPLRPRNPPAQRLHNNKKRARRPAAAEQKTKRARPAATQQKRARGARRDFFLRSKKGHGTQKQNTLTQPQALNCLGLGFWGCPGAWTAMTCARLLGPFKFGGGGVFKAFRARGCRVSGVRGRFEVM